MQLTLERVTDAVLKADAKYAKPDEHIERYDAVVVAELLLERHSSMKEVLAAVRNPFVIRGRCSW